MSFARSRHASGSARAGTSTSDQSSNTRSNESASSAPARTPSRTPSAASTAYARSALAPGSVATTARRVAPPASSSTQETSLARGTVTRTSGSTTSLRTSGTRTDSQSFSHGLTSSAGRILSATPSVSPTPASSSPQTSPWARNGPLYTHVCEPSHPRPVLCLAASAKHNMVVSGSADHALRVFSLDSGRFERELFTRTSGHKEWVTTCSIMERDGRIVSGGMDAAGCLWHAGTKVCSWFAGHTQPLTKVSADDGTMVLTASMDGTLKMWDCSGVDPQELFTYTEHGGLPVTTFRWTRTLVVSADKGSVSLMRRAGLHEQAGVGGSLHVWDTTTGSTVLTFPGHPNSTVLAVSLLGTEYSSASTSFDPSFVPDIVVSGGTDGYVRIWDTRTGEAICSRRLSQGNPGAVTDISACGYGAAHAELKAEFIEAQRKWDRMHDRECKEEDTDSLDREATDIYEIERLSGRDRLAAELQDASKGMSYSRPVGDIADLSIMCALNDGHVAVLDPRAGFQTRLALVGHRAPVLAVHACPDGEHVLSTSADGALMCHSTRATGSVVRGQVVVSGAASASSVRDERKTASAPARAAPPASSGLGLAGLADLYAALGDSESPIPTASQSSAGSRATASRPARSGPTPADASRSRGVIPTRAPSWGMCVSKGPTTDEARAIVGNRDGGRAVGCLVVGADYAVTAGEDGTPLVLYFASMGRKGNASAEWVE